MRRSSRPGPRSPRPRAAASGSRSRCPQASPPPPSGTSDAAQLRDLVEQLEADAPLARDHVGIVEGWQKASPPSLGSLASQRRRSRRPCPRSASAVAPSSAAGSVFEIGASTGTNSSQGTPARCAAYASARPWFPAVPATTPRCGLLPEGVELRADPAQLERARRLQVLGLEPDRAAEQVVDRRDPQRGRPRVLVGDRRRARRRSGRARSPPVRATAQPADSSAERTSREELGGLGAGAARRARRRRRGPGASR